MQKKVILITMAFSLLGFISACSNRHQLADLPVFSEKPLEGDENQAAIDITYTGTAGALLQIGQHAVMLDPYFSNNSFSFSDFFSPPQSNKKVIDALLPDISAVSGILIGHAHADHLLDAPYVLSKAPAQAKIYGSVTASNIIAPLVSPDRRVALNEVMATHQRVGRWLSLSDPYIRVMAIKSDHAPQLGPIMIGAGEVLEEQKTVPASSDWKAGQPMTYLVDFLRTPLESDGQKADILYRVFLQSSASGPQLGYPPAQVLAEHSVDLALLCVASFNNVENYPEHTIGAVKPQNIMLIHWDDFMTSRVDGDVAIFPYLDVSEFIQRARVSLGDDGEILMPMPGTSFKLAIDNKRNGSMGSVVSSK